MDLITLLDDNGTFNDLSHDLNDYLNFSIQHSWVASEDKIYVGLYKPYYALYFAASVVSPVSQEFVFEYWNGTAWTVFNADDRTRGFTRSDFINLPDLSDDWEESEVNGEDAFWIRISAPLDFDVTMQGLNIVFANDDDFRKNMRNVDKLLAKGDSSFIAYHVAARDEIIQKIRNSGHAKKAVEDIMKNITKWDVLDYGEIREAAAHLALSKLMFDISQNTDDKYYQRFRDEEENFGHAFATYYRTIDFDDDGKRDENENMYIRTVQVNRL